MSIGYIFSGALNKFLKSNVQHYCQLETANDPFDLVTNEGGLLTAFEIQGSYSIIGENAFYKLVEGLTQSLSPILRRPGHRIQFVFRRDPLNSKEALRRSVESSVKTLDHLQLDLTELIREREEVLGEKTVLESCYMVLSTSVRAFSSNPDILKESMKERTEKSIKAGGLRPGDMSQSIAMEVPGLSTLHSGFITQVVDSLSHTLSVRKMTAHEYLNTLRRQITFYESGDQWKPYLPGDNIPVRLVEESPRKNDISHLMWPNIAHQLFSNQPRTNERDPSLLDLSGWVAAPILVDQRPQEPQSFDYLFKSIDKNVPWQMSMVIDSGHDRVTQVIARKKSFASFLAFISSNNRLIAQAGEELMHAATTETMVSMQVSFATWGRDVESARRNKSKLKNAVEAWGQLQVIEERGDAFEAWCNTLPGFSGSHLATPIPMTSWEVVLMSPITRPASPWATGSMLYRTLDNKIFQYMPGSSLQNAQMEIVFAPPGFGKSFYLAAANFGLIARAGNESLPRIGILDIGFSSSLFVQMVKDALPRHMKHLAQSYKLEMRPEFAVNFFDTMLGLQKPLSVDREFVVNMMVMICTPAGMKTPIPRLSELCSILVDTMYDYFSEDKYPKMYEPGICRKVDDLLASYGFQAGTNSVTWWKIVNILFKKGNYQEASLAQRYAVPTLGDATQVLSQASLIRDTYGNSSSGVGSESLVDYLNTMLISATSDYPILSMPTVFDLGEARIVALDLMSVATEGSAQAEKKTALMYLLGRYILSKDFYRKVEYTLPEIPDEYKAYHKKMIERDESVPKKLCMDEYHRTGKQPVVRAQTLVDVREGRKFDVHVTLLSQLLEDFDPKVIKMVNNIIILSKGNSELTAKEIVELFNPSKDAMKLIGRYLTGPGREGSSMLYLAQLKEESAPRLEQILRLTLGPKEIWAYSTTPEDVALRRRLVSQTGFTNAIRILSKAYPRGSAKADIAKLMADNKIEIENLDENVSLFDDLVEKMLKEHSDLIDPTKI